jgi:hypothetical protein
MKLSLFSRTWVFLIIATTMVYSQVPPTLSYQGMLTGSDDNPVEDGIYEMHFNLYGEADPSTPLWSESQSVTVVQGIFNAILGAMNPLELPFDEQYYLGIAIGNEEELSPHIALTSSAYSFRARSIDDGQVVKSINELRDDIMLEAGENVSITEDENKIIISATSSGGTGTITQVTAGDGLTGGGTEGEVTLAVADEGITTENLAESAVTSSKLNNMGASSGQVLRWSGSVWEPGNTEESKWSINEDDIFYTNGRVGIGTTDPVEALDVNGNIQTSGWIGMKEQVPVELRVNNEPVLRIIPVYSNDNFLPNVILGSPTNQIEGENIRAVTISGGESNIARSFAAIGGGTHHTASGSYSAISGGYVNEASGSANSIGGGTYNKASGLSATIGGGESNTASNDYVTVGGGFHNIASGLASTVGGGDVNTASGIASIVPGGSANTASGAFSFAAGMRAKAEHHGAFVWADNTASDFTSTGVNQFLIRASGGVGIGTNNPGGFTLAVNGDAAKPGGGSWSVFSDRRLKRNIRPIDNGILNKLLTLHGYTFEYLDSAIENRLALPGRQVGLMAQEVMEVFPDWVETDDHGYHYVTERGTTAIFVEALRELRREKDTEIESLHSILVEKDHHMYELERRIEYLENILRENFMLKTQHNY